MADTSTRPRPTSQPAQEQDQQPGLEHEMRPRPDARPTSEPGKPRLEGKKALITGGDSGIGRAVAYAFAAEGADVAIVYLPEEEDDAAETQQGVAQYGRKCELLTADLSEPQNCFAVVEQALERLGTIDILVSNAAEQHPTDDFTKVTPQQIEQTFRTNVFSMMHLVQAALPKMKEGSSIIVTTSVTAYQGNGQLLDYSATKGAQVSFVRALSQVVAEKGIRVNAVAPGPIWTPLIPATFPADQVAEFGSDVPLGRAGQPAEVASCFVFLASEDASYITGQVLHPNGGKLVGG